MSPASTQLRESQPSGAAARNPELGHWKKTRRARFILWTIMLALPFSVISSCATMIVMSRVSTLENKVELIRHLPPPDWNPAFSAAADVSAQRFAERFGREVLLRFDTLEQISGVGGDATYVVEQPPDDDDGRRSWTEVETGERFAYLVRNGSKHEILSFVVAFSGESTWPALVPVEGPVADGFEAEGNAFGVEVAAELQAMKDRPGLIEFEDSYEAARSILGITDDIDHPTSCGAVAERHETVPHGLHERVEQMITAYTARDAEAVSTLARSGVEWPLYPRDGWRYQPGSMRLLCVKGLDETSTAGLAQVWWLAEPVTGNGAALPEVRDVVVADSDGLWLVSGADLFMSGGFVPTLGESTS